MKLSVVIICWNDLKCILDCLESIRNQAVTFDSEVIVVDNGSTDDSVEQVRSRYPGARVVENGKNLGFGRGNNEGIRVARGEYVFILNPDTILHEAALERFVTYADKHPEAGAFGCRTLNPDGSLQATAQPRPTLSGCLFGAAGLRRLGTISDLFPSDTYTGWDGLSEREIGFQAGCSLLLRGDLLRSLGGFDPRFFHQYEDADLCERIWKSGRSVRYCPEAVVTHIGGQKRGNYPLRVVLETERSKYRYFHKHFGLRGAARIRLISLLACGLRYSAYLLSRGIVRRPELGEKARAWRTLLRWHWNLDPEAFIENGIEPDVGHKPLASPPGALAHLL